MYDKEVLLDILKNMIDATDKIMYRSEKIHSIGDFLVDGSKVLK